MSADDGSTVDPGLPTAGEEPTQSAIDRKASEQVEALTRDHITNVVKGVIGIYAILGVTIGLGIRLFLAEIDAEPDTAGGLLGGIEGAISNIEAAIVLMPALYILVLVPVLLAVVLTFELLTSLPESSSELYLTSFLTFYGATIVFTILLTIVAGPPEPSAFFSFSLFFATLPAFTAIGVNWVVDRYALDTLPRERGE